MSQAETVPELFRGDDASNPIMILKDITACNAARRRFVLVVDTNARNLKLLTTVLQRFEYKVCTARTAEEALEVASVVSPVLIVTSRQLDGEHTAIELIKTVKKASPKSPAVFIVLTPKPDPAFERACLAAGALVCLRSPLSLENFYRVIQVAIEPVPRMNIRISANLPASIGGTRGSERVCALSEHGAYLLTSARYPLKARIPVQIRLANGVVNAECAVLYANAAGTGPEGQPGLGLQFVRISVQDRERIRKFIKAEMTKDVAS